MRVAFLFSFLLFCFPCIIRAQNARNNKLPVINYKLSVDSSAFSFFIVEMKMKNMPDNFSVAMFAHPEYDDKYWRYIENIIVESPKSKAKITRKDSAAWNIIAPGGEVILKYKIRLPQPASTAAWQPFLSSSGMLTGALHTFMYVEGFTGIGSHISLQFPKGWEVSTGLETTVDPMIFYAASAKVLLDCPILAGDIKQWKFLVDDVPHEIAWLPATRSSTIDSSKLISSISKLIHEASNLFGGLPYKDYHFLFRDNSYGALEHTNSVTIGFNGADLEKYFTSYLSEIAHEYFHNWNIMRIRPAEYGDVSYKKPALSKVLWWSEGMTIFYADLLLRHAHLPTEENTRIKHLETLLKNYYNYPGHYELSAEKVSTAEYAPNGMLGNYVASTHTQGEVIGTLLDIIIMDATNGRSSVDDVMRKLLAESKKEKGFSNDDLEKYISAKCHCNISSFFNVHIHNNKPVDINNYLAKIGLRSSLAWKQATDEEGKLSPDLRLYAYTLSPSGPILLQLMVPVSCWTKAGLQSGDQLLSINGNTLKTSRDFFEQIRHAKIGDIITVEIKRAGLIKNIAVKISGYQQPVIRIEELYNLTPHKQLLKSLWLN